MKKRLAFLLAAAMTATVITGCASNASSSESSTAVLTEGTSGASSSESSTAPASDAAALNGTISFLGWNNESNIAPLLEGFASAYPDIKVEFQYAPPVKDYVEKLSTMLYSGSAPDVFQMALENREDLMKGNYVEDLSNESYMTDGTIPDFAKTVYSMDDKVYSLAVASWVGGIYYNKALFEKVGITAEPQTWDEFLALCKTLKDAGINPIMDNCQDAAVHFVPALFGAETYTQDPDFTKKIFDGSKTFADGWTKPYQMWYQLVEQGYLTKDMVGVTSDQMVTEFATEQVAMILSGPWNINTIAGINPDLDYKCMGLPGTEAGNIWYDGAVEPGFCINSSSPNKELAKAFLGYIATPEGLQKLYEGNGAITVAKGFTPEVAPQITDAVAKMLEGKIYIPMGEWHSYTEALRVTYLTGLQDCMVGSITTDEAVAQLDAKLAEMKSAS